MTKIVLTPREFQILELRSQGLTTAQISSKIGVKQKTVAWHIENLSLKYGEENVMPININFLLNSKRFTVIKHLSSCKSKERRIKVYFLYKQGVLPKDIAARLLISVKTVYALLQSIKSLR